MSEKAYKTIGLSGACNIVVGIVALVVGIASGVLLIVTGAGLLKCKSNQLI